MEGLVVEFVAPFLSFKDLVAIERAWCRRAPDSAWSVLLHRDWPHVAASHNCIASTTATASSAATETPITTTPTVAVLSPPATTPAPSTKKAIYASTTAQVADLLRSMAAPPLNFFSVVVDQYFCVAMSPPPSPYGSRPTRRQQAIMQEKYSSLKILPRSGTTSKSVSPDDGDDEDFPRREWEDKFCWAPETEEDWQTVGQLGAMMKIMPSLLKKKTRCKTFTNYPFWEKVDPKHVSFLVWHYLKEGNYSLQCINNRDDSVTEGLMIESYPPFETRFPNMFAGPPNPKKPKVADPKDPNVILFGQYDKFVKAFLSFAELSGNNVWMCRNCGKPRDELSKSITLVITTKLHFLCLWVYLFRLYG
ncbi:hypothetical protein Pelo_16101 [Pelomyxa schiedti]|nr:hypothetical protein Pelo_16101 [Pelomyxa schiedti]